MPPCDCDFTISLRYNREMWRYLENAAWIIAFMLLSGFFASQVVKATRVQHLAASQAAERTSNTGQPWICPIAGQCGPPGTPGLGRW